MKNRTPTSTILIVSLLLAILIGILVPCALAQEATPSPETAMDLAAFLSWLLTAGGALFLGAGISFVAEKLPAFQRIPTEYKFPTVTAATIISALIIRVAVVITPPHIITAIQPYWQTAIVALLALIGSQVTHKKFP